MKQRALDYAGSRHTYKHTVDNIISYLCKLVHLFNERGEGGRDADIDQALNVLHGLLIAQVQSELVLHLKFTQTNHCMYCTACSSLRSSRNLSCTWTYKPLLITVHSTLLTQKFKYMQFVIQMQCVQYATCNSLGGCSKARSALTTAPCKKRKKTSDNKIK